MRSPSPTVQVSMKVLYAAFEILRERGGEVKGREIVAEVPKRVALDDWATERYESGYIRWQTFLQYYSSDCVKAGFLRKKSGTWFLTAEGEKAMALGEERFFQAAVAAYRKWDAERKQMPEPANGEEETPTPAGLLATMDQIETLANESIERHIRGKNPYEFQDLVAALLRGMGYFTPFVAPRGKDGGVDIVAYRDALGTMSPHIKVQVKHRQSPASVEEIRQLMGLLQRDGDVGIFISTGGFTSDARSLAQGGHVHVELIDLTRFIELWQGNYSKLSDKDKVLMPLVPVHFLAETD